MQVPKLGTRAERFLNRYGRYHLARLRADPQAVEWAAEFAAAQDRLQGRIERHRETKMQSITAKAVRDARNAAVDAAVRALFFRILALTGNDRSSSLYQRYFPKGLWSYVTLSPRRKVGWIDNLLVQLNEEREHELLAQVAPITDALDRLVRSLAEHDAAVDARKLAAEELREEKRRWIDAYRLSERRLKLLFYHDAKIADRYFIRTERKKKRNGKRVPAIRETAVILPMEPRKERADSG